jgi:signal peptidase I
MGGVKITGETWVALRTRRPVRLPARHWLRLLYELASSFCGAVLLVFLLFTFVCKPITVSGNSMKPTLNDGQWLLMSAQPPTLERGRIAVISENNGVHKPLIKRIIALPGDTVDIDFQRGVVSVNGAELWEPYTASPTNRSADVVFPLTVEPGACFVLGDNRNFSQDSRFSSVGAIDQRNIIGLVVFP